MALFAGGIMVANRWTGPGLLLVVGSAVGMLACAATDRITRDRAAELVLTGSGTLGLLAALPGTWGYFAQDAGVLTGLITLGSGLVILAAGERRWTRWPRACSAIGAAGLLAGAALTGAQSSGLAPILGAVTAVGLIVAGMITGRMLFSVLGSLGLLVNVAWIILRYFPGQGRVPLLTLVCGALVLGGAVLLARTGNRPGRGPKPRLGA